MQLPDTYTTTEVVALYPGDPKRAFVDKQDYDRLRAELENEKARGIHSCHQNCTFSGCVNEKLRAEIDGLRTGDTCERQCEGTAYRIEPRHWPETIAENEVMP